MPDGQADASGLAEQPRRLAVVVQRVNESEAGAELVEEGVPLAQRDVGCAMAGPDRGGESSAVPRWGGAAVGHHDRGGVVAHVEFDSEADVFGVVGGQELCDLLLPVVVV